MLPTPPPGTRNASVAVGLVLALHGCADVPAPAHFGVTYDTIDGVERIMSSGPGAWTHTGGAWTTDETSGVVIGEVEGADEYVFGQISGVVVDSEGRIHVADAQAREIRVFSPDGRFLRRLGREGEGPGEFHHISGLARAPDGIAALDGNLGRVTVFGPSGGVVRTFRLERTSMIIESNAPMRFDSEGRFFDRARLSRTEGIDSVGVVTYNADGTVTDTAFLAEIHHDRVTLEQDGRPYMSIPRPFAPHTSIAFGPEGMVYLARGGEYRVEVFSPTGELVRIIRRPVEPRPVTDGERDSARAFIAEAFEPMDAALPAGVSLPERSGVIARLVVDSEGYLWVLGEHNGGAGRFEWCVHDPAGRYLGTVTTPEMAVMEIGKDFLAGKITDELGVQRAVILPLAKPH